MAATTAGAIPTTVPARPVGPFPGIPPLPRRRGAAVRRRVTPRERWRVAWDRGTWYLTKWFRQMLHVLTHPEDAFWELKRAGDWWSVPTLLLAWIFARMGVMGFMGFHYIFQGVEKDKWNFERIMQQIASTFTISMANFIYNGNPEDTSILQEGFRITIPFITWCLAHYAIAMIFYGEGGLKDIMVAGVFSFTPFIFFSWPASLLLTNSTTLSERQLYFSINWIVNFIWALLALVYALTTNTYEFFYELFYELTTR